MPLNRIKQEWLNIYTEHQRYTTPAMYRNPCIFVKASIMQTRIKIQINGEKLRKTQSKAPKGAQSRATVGNRYPRMRKRRGFWECQSEALSCYQITTMRHCLEKPRHRQWWMVLIRHFERDRGDANCKYLEAEFPFEIHRIVAYYQLWKTQSKPKYSPNHAYTRSKREGLDENLAIV